MANNVCSYWYLLSITFCLICLLTLNFAGITSNLFVIALVCMISWYQLIHSEDYKTYVKNLQKLKDFESSFDYDDDEDDGKLRCKIVNVYTNKNV